MLCEVEKFPTRLESRDGDKATLPYRYLGTLPMRYKGKGRYSESTLNSTDLRYRYCMARIDWEEGTYFILHTAMNPIP
jgi:hypothetical protein